MAILPLFELPVGHSWTNQLGLTLIGDAAHLMSPCASESVNVAMADALSLATAIAGAVEES
jgi:2-polyprenyl-6-methoxyphenol hydroxylase-like FAD-dependent oxidoreductase